MKVVFISAADSIHTIRWVNALSEKGIEVVLLSLKNHNNAENNINKNIKIIYLPIKGIKGYYLNSFFVNNIIKREKPDLINIHYASGYGTLGRFIKFENKLLNVWGSDVYDFPNQSSLKKKILIKNLLAYKGIASTSYCMAKEIEKYLKNKEIYITPFGVDTDLFKNLNYKKDKNKIIIGIVKTLAPTYGIEYLIRAIKELEDILEKEIFNKIEVHIYGKGYLEEELKQLTVDLNLGEKVKFLGFIKNTDVPKAINKMDIFVVPSLEESFGVAAVEAMACEIPVIASDADGLKEVVVNNEIGFIVPKKDFKAIAKKLKELILNKKLRVEFGKNGRKRVLELYNWNDNVDKMIEIYKELKWF